MLTLETDGVPTKCAISLDNVQTVHKDFLDDYQTTLSSARMREVITAIEFAFGFAALKQNNKDIT